MDYSIVSDWDELIDSLPADRKDVYFTKSYVSLYESDDNPALCAVCTDSDKVMLLPYLRGRIDGYYDFETAYGYGGPVTNVDDRDWYDKALSGMYNYLKDEGYLCGFIRFHPVLENHRLAEEISNTDGQSLRVLFDRRTVSMDTSTDIDDIWQKQVSSKNRNMIRKAEKNGLVYNSEYEFESMDDFIRLYIDTMERIGADRFYFFDQRYFNSIKQKLSGNAFLGTVRKDGKLICAAIFLYSNCYGHYHLEGSDREYASFGANNYLLWKAACEMHGMGIKEFHLGGGTTTQQDDSLFKFKKSFSRNARDFFIGKEIFNIPVYESIVEDWSRKNSDLSKKYANHLLRYRYM